MRRSAVVLAVIALAGWSGAGVGTAAQVGRAFADVDLKLTGCRPPFACGVNYVHLHVVAYDVDPAPPDVFTQTADTGSIDCAPLDASSLCPFAGPLPVAWVQLDGEGTATLGAILNGLVLVDVLLHDGGAPGNRVIGPDLPFPASLGGGETFVTPTLDFVTAHRFAGADYFGQVLDGNVTIHSGK